jgi:hypothetical protein
MSGNRGRAQGMVLTNTFSLYFTLSLLSSLFFILLLGFTWPSIQTFREGDNVVDIKFAPEHLGLLLAVCVSVGVIKIYKGDESRLEESW